MKNLILESIEKIYNDGAFAFWSEDYGYGFTINEEKKLILTRMKKKHLYEGELCVKVDESSNKFYIETALSELAFSMFFDPDNDIVFESIVDIVDEQAKLEVINFMYEIYKAMLAYTKTKIKTLLDDKCIFHFGVKDIPITKYSQDNPPLDFETIKKLLQDLTEDFLQNIKEAQEAKEENETSNTSYISKNSQVGNRGINKVSNYMDTKELDKAKITYEIINERKFLINPAIGREKEIREVGSTLLNPSYSVILLGPSGVGKTAIIEGLGYAIENSETKVGLKNKKIIKISPQAIVSGCKYVGMFEEKMESVIKFFKNNPDAILYMDEFHTAIGAGSSAHDNNDILNMLKPYIENGSIKLIAATTTQEYDKYLTQDSAFTSRLKVVNVDEPSKEVLKEIIIKSIEKYENITNIIFEEDIVKKEKMIDLLIKLTDNNYRDYKEKRYNPRLVLSIIEASFGYARYDLENMVGSIYLKEAINACESIYKSVREQVVYKLESIKSNEEKVKVIEFKNYKK